MSKRLMIWSSCLLLQLSLNPLCHAFTSNNTPQKQYDTEISAIFQELAHQKPMPIGDKIEWISKHWLNRPYKLYCLGEGPQGDFDQRPIYRTDGFDCETFIDMSLALAFSENLSQFKQNIRRIRYHDNVVDFVHRNHFTNIDWNDSNQKQGFIKDITLNITSNHRSLAIENTITNKKNQWYQQISSKRVYLIAHNSKLITEKTRALHQQAQLQGQYVSKIKYIPISSLYDKNEQPKRAIFSQIPHGAIIEIVTPNSDTEKLIGTNLDISHLGFALYKNKQLYFRNASMLNHRVVDEPLAVYLKKYIHSEKIKGIHIEMPLEQTKL